MEKLIYEEQFDATDYTDHLLEAYRIVDARLIREEFLYFLGEAETGVMENSMILLEATKESFFEKVKAFFNNLWTAFTDKAKALIQSNETWLKENKERILNRTDFKNLEITIFPYWKFDVSDMDKVINDAIAAMQETVKTATRAQESGDDKELMAMSTALARRMNISDVNSADEFKTAMYNLYRTGEFDKLESVRLTGDELAQHVTKDIYPFCQNYKDTINKLKAFRIKLENELRRVDQALSQKQQSNAETTSTNETYYSVTEAAVHMLFEADGDQKNDASGDAAKQTDTKGNDQKKPDNGVVTKRSDSAADKDLNGGEGNYRDMSSSVLQIKQDAFKSVQMVMTSMMTALEERFVKYMAVLRGMVSKGKRDDSAKVERKENTGEKQEGKKEEPAKEEGKEEPKKKRRFGLF